MKNIRNQLTPEQKYFARQLTEVYRYPRKYSGVYKQNLYELADREKVIHFTALKINQSMRRYRKAAGS